jgi:hypothetical protein
MQEARMAGRIFLEQGHQVSVVRSAEFKNLKGSTLKTRDHHNA